MEEFLRFVIGQLVEFPDEIVLTKTESPDKVIFHLTTRKSDVPKSHWKRRAHHPSNPHPSQRLRSQTRPQSDPRNSRMKALFLAITVITCLCGLGCEMHPESPRTRGGQATEAGKTLQQAAARPSIRTLPRFSLLPSPVREKNSSAKPCAAATRGSVCRNREICSKTHWKD